MGEHDNEIMPENIVYNLSNKNNYKSTLDDQVIMIQLSYVKVVHYYILHYFENMANFNIFVQGFKAITHIFLFLLMYTKNLEMTIYHCQNAIFYYIEYISQITDKDDNMFFNLTLRDAVVYIYTKTIYDIDEQHRQTFTTCIAEQNILSQTTDFVHVYGKIATLITTDDKFTSVSTDAKKELLRNLRTGVENFIISHYKTENPDKSISRKLEFILVDCENNRSNAYQTFDSCLTGVK
jgi:hypothetical protein